MLKENIMTADGYSITQDQIDACVERMTYRPFNRTDIMIAAEEAGVPRCERVDEQIIRRPSIRLASRVIKREKKAGNIEHITRTIWRWRMR